MKIDIPFLQFNATQLQCVLNLEMRFIQNARAIIRFAVNSTKDFTSNPKRSGHTLNKKKKLASHAVRHICLKRNYLLPGG